MIVSLTDKRLVHSKEIMSAMGLRLFPDHDGHRCSPLLSFLDGCSRCQRMPLCGNGVHAPTYLAWILYVLSNIVRLDNCEEPARSLASMVPDDSSDDSDIVENTKREGVAEEDIEESAGGPGKEESDAAASSIVRRDFAEESDDYASCASSSERRALGLSSPVESDHALDDPTMGGLFQFGDDFVFPVGDFD